MRRREFLKAAALSGAAAEGLLSHATAAEPASSPASDQLPQRTYKGDERISIIGFPGFALDKLQQADADAAVRTAIGRGVTYFDVAPSYGNAIKRLGPALEPYRKSVFLACKTTMRDRAGTDKELRQSLKDLRTDHFNLYQLHAITDVKKDVDAAFGKGGAMEVFIEARKAGVVRHLGFSAHSVEAAVAAMDRFDFDSALVPVNFACWHKGGFGPQIVEAARKKNVMLLALKGMARQKWPAGDPQRQKYPRCWYQPISDPHEATLALRFTLSQPIAAAVPPADVSLLWLAIDVATQFKPITPAEVSEMTRMAAEWTPVFAKV